MTDSSDDRTAKEEKLVEEVKVEQPKDISTDGIDIKSVEDELAAGARAFAFKNYAIATECFSKACEKLTTHHSENHKAIIDAHISYGKALLRNAISLSSVLGDINNNNKNDVDETEVTTQEVNGNGHSSSGATTSNQAVGVPGTSKGSSKPQLPGLAKTPQIHFSGDSSDDEKGDDEDDDDDNEAAEEPVTAEEELENAFQVLEFARQSIQSQIDTSLINQKSSIDTHHLQNKLIDVYDLIAQVHQEGEQFEQAVEAYTNSLQIKKSRTDIAAGGIAETHLMIALALELIPDNGESLKKAISHVEEAIELMKGHLSNLHDKMNAVEQTKGSSNKAIESTKKSDENHSIEKNDKQLDDKILKLDIEETKSLIDELEAKKEELKTVPQAPPMSEADKALQAYLNAINNKPNGDLNGKAIINDLSSLVKKRSRPTESSEPKTSSASASAPQTDSLESTSKKPKIASNETEP